MNTTTSLAFITGAFVVVGEWVKKKSFGVKAAIGVGFYVLMLSMLDSANHDVAVRLAGLILLVAVLENGIPILKALGLTK